MDPQEALQRQKKSLEIAEFERKLFEEQQADLEAAIETRREELVRSGQENQKLLQRETEEIKEQEQENIDYQEEQENQELQNQIQVDLKAEDDNVVEDDYESNEEEEDQDAVGSAGAKKKTKVPKSSKPRFPVFMFPLAIFKDLLDLLLTLTGVGVILVFVYSFIYNIALFLWCLGKKNLADKSSGLKRRPKGVMGKYIFTAIMELFPGIGALPLATWFVWNTYMNQIIVWKRRTSVSSRL